MSVKIKQETFNKLYEETNKMAYYTALSILKNETDAQDIVQNSYVSAYTKLEQLKDISSFAAWLKIIVINNCKNLLKCRKPDFFNTAEEESDFLDNVADQDENFLPENYIMQQTKRQQVIDIIDRLPLMQKTTILLFYYDELSVKEIAEIMECNESTVTSRISYAKKFIRREVELLEKKGDKIYATAPTFLARLFLADANSRRLIPPTAESIWQHISPETHNSLPGGKPTAAQNKLISKITKKYAAWSLPAKCAAAGAAAVILIGAIAIPIVAATKKSNDTKSSVGGTSSAETGETSSVSIGEENAEELTSDQSAADQQSGQMSPEQAASFSGILNQIVSKYGVYSSSTSINDCADFSENNHDTWLNSSGLAYAQLVDLNGDGTQELYFYYLQPQQENEYQDSPTLVEDVWNWDGTNAAKIYSESFAAGSGHTVDGERHFFSAVDGKTYLMSAGSTMSATGDLTGLVGVENYSYSAGILSGSTWIEKSRLDEEVDTYLYEKAQDYEYEYKYGISTDGAIVSSGGNPLGKDFSDDEAGLQATRDENEKQWFQLYQVDNGKSQPLFSGAYSEIFNWQSNDVKGLISQLSSTAGPTMALKSLPYIGDISKCQMSAQQATAYIDVLHKVEQSFSSGYEKNFAVLIDVSGDGVPLLLVWGGNLPYEECGVEPQYWGYQNGTAVKLPMGNLDTGIATWDGEVYFCNYNEIFSLDSDELHDFYRVKNGKLSKAHTMKWDNSTGDSLFTIDGKSVNQEQYEATLQAMTLETLFKRDDMTSIGQDNSGSIFDTLTQNSISQVAGMLSDALPGLE